MDKIPNTINDTVSKILDQLATRFGATGAHLYALMIRQVYVNSILAIVIACIIGIAAKIAYYHSVKWSKKYDEGYRPSDSAKENQCGFFVLSCVLATVAFIVLAAGIQGLANPEYYAINNILQMVK